MNALLGLGSALWRELAPWVRAVLLGTALGLAIVAAQRAGLWSALAACAAELSSHLSPLWVPMLALALRVAWLCARALRSRLGSGADGRRVKPELARLAPLFLAFGVAGALWQLDGALGALERDGLDAAPRALAGALLPAAIGAALQHATRWIGARAPAWSLARVTRSGERELYRLDRALLGEGEQGLAALLDALDARAPDALHLDLDALLPAARSAVLRARIAERVDGPVAPAPQRAGLLAAPLPPGPGVA